MKVFLTFFYFLQIVASLVLTLQSTTFVAQPSLLLWTREIDVDGNHELNFDLRFVEGTDQKEGGMAVSGIHASSSQQFGTAQVVFPEKGTYQVMAVNGSKNLGTSNTVAAVSPPASVSASASILASVSSQPTGTSKPASSLTRQHNKASIIVGSVMGALILLAILVMLIMLLIRRRRRFETRRWTFYRDLMVQSRLQSAPISSSSSNSACPNPHPGDLEQGVHTLASAVPSTKPPPPDPQPRIPDPVVYPSRMVGAQERRPTLRRLDLDPSSLSRSPMGPRPPLSRQVVLTPSSSLRRSARPMSPIPRSPSPRTHRQRAIADQIEMLRIQMLEVERESTKDHIGMSEMSEKMAWLREQQEGSWALGLTEVTPLGYERYMT